MMKEIIRRYLNKDIKNYLYNIKIFLRRLGLLFFKGHKYISLSGSLHYLCKKAKDFRYVIGPTYKNKIVWLGAFPPMHSNMGDHAQTLAVEQFFNNEFPEYHVIRIYRDKINIARLKKISSTLGKNDLVFIHSSGDFGSKYHDIENSYCKKRKEIINIFNKNKIIHLPTTVYYENNEKGRIILEQDKQFYKHKDITILGRESISSDFLASNFECNSRFFPDFVFYLKPNIIKKSRKGALLLLRSDLESGLSNEERNKIIDIVKEFTKGVHDKDILKSYIPVIDIILKNYIESICDIYQNYEFVITDRMHGMIIAIVTRTPCIAISGGIPHKISAYKSFFSKSVEFISEIEEIGSAIKRIRSKFYQESDLSSYFDNFRRDVLGSDINSITKKY